MHGNRYYWIKSVWKQLAELAQSQNMIDKAGLIHELASSTAVDQNLKLIEEVEDCVLSPSSARLCEIQVAGDAKLRRPFDPYNAKIFLDVNHVKQDDDGGGVSALLNIGNQPIVGGIKRDLTIFVNGVRLGRLPQVVDIGTMMNEQMKNSRKTDCMVLSTLNEESGNSSFHIIHFVDGRPKSDEILTISCSPENAKFVKLEEFDHVGVINEIDFSNRIPTFTINRGMGGEMHLLITASSLPVLNLSIMKKDVEVMLDGARIRTDEYKVLMLGEESVIHLQDRYMTKKIVITSRNSIEHTPWSYVLWCIYICGYLSFGGLSQFMESLVAYQLATLLLGLPYPFSPGSIFVRPLLLFFKDATTTRQFGDMLLLSMVGFFLLLALALCFCLPKSVLICLRSQIAKNSASISVCFNSVLGLMAILHVMVFSNKRGHVYILGRAIHHKAFKLSSVTAQTCWCGICIWVLIKTIRRLVGEKNIPYSQMPDFSRKLTAALVGRTGYNYFIEDKKVYKVNFTESDTRDRTGKHGSDEKEVEVVKVASVPMSAYYRDTDVTFRSLRRDFKGFEDITMACFVKLKDLELVSLMKEKVKVWLSLRDPSTRSVNKGDTAALIRIASTTFDCCFVFVALLSSDLWRPSLTLSLFYLLLKLSIFCVGVMARYKGLSTGWSRADNPGGVSLYKLCKSDELFQALLNKCGSAVAFLLYFVLLGVCQEPIGSAAIHVLKYFLIGWAFDIKLSKSHIRKFVEGFSAVRKKGLSVYFYAVAMYRFWRLQLLPRLIVFIKKCIYFRWLKNPEEGDEGSWLTQSYTNVVPIKVWLLDLSVLDVFKFIYRPETPRMRLKSTVIHPSVNIRFGDLSPSYTVNGVDLSTVPQSSTHELSVIKDGNIDFGSKIKLPTHNRLSLPDESLTQETIGTCGPKNEAFTFTNEYENTENVASNIMSMKSATEGRIDCVGDFGHMKPSAFGYERLFGVVEWRPQKQSESKFSFKRPLYTSYSGNDKKVHLYINVGSLNLVPLARPPKIVPSVTYDKQRNLLTIVTPFIRTKDKYTVRCLSRGDAVVASTSVICRVSCVDGGTLAFGLVEKMNHESSMCVYDAESGKSCIMQKEDIAFDMNSNTEQVILYNSEFTEGQEYVVSYESALHEANLIFIYTGCSHEVFKEIAVPVDISVRGLYDFVIQDKTASSQRICAVTIDPTAEDTYCFGMKSAIVNTVENVNLNYPGIGRARFTENTFYFQDSMDEKLPLSTSKSKSRSLSVKNCKYILGDNMSFLVPITVVGRLRSITGEDVFRVIPHYNILAYELINRIDDLKIAMQFLRSQLQKLNADKMDHEEFLSPTEVAKTEGDTGVTTETLHKSLGCSTHIDNERNPETVFEEVIAALFPEETLQEFETQEKHGLKYLGKPFLPLLRIILTFCTHQLEEALCILFRQDELTRDVALRTEMQKFDTMTGQGMMIEDVTESLNNVEEYNYFLPFPFILKAEEIYARVNVDREARFTKSITPFLICVLESTNGDIFQIVSVMRGKHRYVGDLRTVRCSDVGVEVVVKFVTMLLADEEEGVQYEAYVYGPESRLVVEELPSDGVEEGVDGGEEGVQRIAVNDGLELVSGGEVIGKCGPGRYAERFEILTAGISIGTAEKAREVGGFFGTSVVMVAVRAISLTYCGRRGYFVTVQREIEETAAHLFEVTGNIEEEDFNGFGDSSDQVS
ncbi:uncharacterized protein BcabD6B2_38060 [Babesia caballi]|uniref:Membrane protein, putative n=1 Tax=Babesia caballi TaxID=5871 RepID=A0AAV4LWZ8_BABCB|nr:membrane protein, putative [Babesia caballi]